MHIKRRKLRNLLLVSIITLVLIINPILESMNVISFAEPAITELKPYGDCRNINLANVNLKDKYDLLITQTFDSHTVWPTKDKLPNTFDPKAVLEWGKDPGLGVRKLHEMGFTGKGVNVAYIDQPLLMNHNAYKELNIVYTKIRPDVGGMSNASMHGPAVLSILAGKNTGVAPESKVTFFGHPSWLADQTTHAEALRKLVEMNKALPDDQKIRIVGLSDCPDVSEKNIEAYKKAILEAEASGIMVIDVLSQLNITPLEIQFPKDKSKSLNYKVAQWAISSIDRENALFVPTSGMTTAVGNNNDVNDYAFWTNGGLSWAVPYVVGTIALGLQVDPSLTEEEAYSFLKQSQTPYHNGGIINPEGFLARVKQNIALKNSDSDYCYILYNGSKISSNDKIAILDYAMRLSNDSNNYVLKDVSGYDSATEILTSLIEQSKLYQGKVKGVQIFGSSSDVPAFNIHFKVQMQNSIDDSGNFNSDLFYGNFDSNVQSLKNDFSIYKAFQENLEVNFVPQWPVARLPLSAGAIAPFINKYYDYRLLTKNYKPPYVNFSNPIFAQTTHSDDMSYFIKERLDKEFKLLKASEYRLYGNKEGLFPVKTEVLGNFDNQNLKKENENGIANFIINSHGQSGNIDQCIHINPKDLGKYKDRLRFSSPYNGNLELLELRMSFLNMTTINTLLSKNYYTLMLWTCSNAQDLRSDNLAHEALAKGKAVEVMAASSIISNNGVNNSRSLSELKKNNFYYFTYEFFNQLSKGLSRSESFFVAKKLYATEILKHTDLLGEGNYGFNLHNVLSYHYLGVLDIPNTQNTGKIQFPVKDIIPTVEQTHNIDQNAQSTAGNIKFTDTNKLYKPIVYQSKISDKAYKFDTISVATAADKLFIKVSYYSPKDDYIALFLQGDAPGLMEIINDGTKQGINTVFLCFTKAELEGYKASLAVNIGSRNYAFIDKTMLLTFFKDAVIVAPSKPVIE